MDMLFFGFRQCVVDDALGSFGKLSKNNKTHRSRARTTESTAAAVLNSYQTYTHPKKNTHTLKILHVYDDV